MDIPASPAHEVDSGNVASRLQHTLQLLFPRPHPARQVGLYTFGVAQLDRHKSLGQTQDLDQSILFLTEAILLPFRAGRGYNILIIEILFKLASALLRRAETSKQPDDANSAIQCFRWLLGQSLDKLGIKSNEVMTVMTSLMEALAVRAELGSGDGMQDIKDMVAVCSSNDLSSSDTPETFKVLAAVAFGRVINACGNRNRPFLDQSTKHLREANIRRPNSPVLSFALADSLISRFDEAPTDSDLEEATTLLHRIHDSPRPGNSLNAWQLLTLSKVAKLANIRCLRYGKPEHAEEAMSHLRSLRHHSVTNNDLPILPKLNMALEMMADLRFMSFGVKDSSTLQEALSLSPKHVRVRHSGFLRHDAPQGNLTEVEARIRDSQGVFPTTRGTSHYRKSLEELVNLFNAKVSLTNDLVDIEEAIKYCRLLRDSTPPGGISSCLTAMFLAHHLELAFERTHKMEDLNEHIDLLVGILKDPAGQTLCEFVVEKLIHSLGRRQTSHLEKQEGNVLEAARARVEYLQNVIMVHHLVMDNRFSPLPRRLVHSYNLAQALRMITSHLEIGVGPVSAVYDKAMSLMQDCLMFAPNLPLQHTHLISMPRVTAKISMDYASHLVNTGQLGRAIETLERGRALLWSELRSLRTSTHNIAGVDPVLAEKFKAINWDLEKLTMSVLPSSSTEDNDDETAVGEGADPFGQLLMKQRRLVEERDSIISQVRSLPGSENFLMAPSFDTLRAAASHGPVIIINHSEWRSDILILLYDSPPSLIPTSKGFYDDANRLRDDLLDARKKQGLDSKLYDRTLASILVDLYNLVGRPVIDRLRELKIQEQSRVWWCPTSAFCSLPLHAMGPIPSDDGEKLYFSDLYIPSYVPTLSALIESRNPDPQSQPPKQPSLLLVAQPDRSLPGVKGEIKVIQGLDIEVESLILKGAKTAAVLESLKRHELVHFACHGNLEIEKPFDASFKLHKGERLKLLDIVHSRLPTAEFAFLSACHTAELTEGSIADEGLHLTAALQYCGFRSVVGTMWAMADTDGRDLARHVYRSMLSGNDEGPCYLRSAAALRDAVRELRNSKGVGLERWVNFVHYGA